MARMTEKTLEKWASEIADAYFNEGVPLNDGVTKMAQELDLNPEQIRRLVEAVNTSTFLQKFNSMGQPDANAQDRIVEFETADPNVVINRMLDTAKTAMIHAPATTGPSNDFLSLPITREDAAPLPEKTAEVEEPAEPPIRRSVVVLRLRKAAEQLKTAEYQARVQFTEATQALADRFRRLNCTSFETFEKDAFYHYGEAAVPHLQLMRQALRKPTANYDLGDMRKHARFINTKTAEMRHLEEMMNWTKQRRHAEAALKKVEGNLARL